MESLVCIMVALVCSAAIASPASPRGENTGRLQIREGHDEDLVRSILGYYEQLRRNGMAVALPYEFETPLKIDVPENEKRIVSDPMIKMRERQIKPSFQPRKKASENTGRNQVQALREESGPTLAKAPALEELSLPSDSLSRGYVESIGSTFPLTKRYLEQSGLPSPLVKRYLEQIGSPSPLVKRYLEQIGSPSPLVKRYLEQIGSTSPLVKRYLEQIGSPSPLVKRYLEQIGSPSPLVKRYLEQIGSPSPLVKRYLEQIGSPSPLVKRYLDQIGSQSPLVKRYLEQIGSPSPLVKRKDTSRSEIGDLNFPHISGHAPGVGESSSLVRLRVPGPASVDYLPPQKLDKQEILVNIVNELNREKSN